jgi:hypothetical protein
MPRMSQASRSTVVTLRSAGEGLGSPLGWLWQILCNTQICGRGSDRSKGTAHRRAARERPIKVMAVTTAMALSKDAVRTGQVQLRP